MSDLNNCVFVGRLGADPEIHVTPDGQTVSKFRICVNNYVKGAKNKAGKVTNEEPMWMSCSIWGQRAEFVERYAMKGMQVTVTGRLRNRAYIDREGNERTSLELTVNDISVPFGDSDIREHAKSVGAETVAAGSLSNGDDGILEDFPDDPLLEAAARREAASERKTAPAPRTRR